MGKTRGVRSILQIFKMPPKKFKKRKNKPKKNWDEPDEIKKAPHSIVIFRGNVGKYIEELMRDFRRVMEPNTASSLKASDKNTIKDFVSVSGPLNVSHLVMFSRSEISPYMRLCRLPHGPTLTFKILQYSLSKDIVSVQKRQHTYDKQYLTHPLVVLNNFSGEALQLQLMTSMFQNMFPSINVATVKLNSIRRCVLLHYHPEDGSVEFRHYSVKAVPVGVSKAVKRLVQSKVPDLSNLNDISEFISRSGQFSDSEAEDDPVSKVTLPQNLAGRGSKAGSKSAVRLMELGPRIRMELLKIEEGLVEGEVLYHKYIQKTEEEKKTIKLRRAQQQNSKEKLRKIQEANVKKKEENKQKLKEKSMEGMRRKQAMAPYAQNEEDGEADKDDDDAEYYRKEVGQEPEKDLFASGVKSKKSSLGGPAAKRAKIEKKKFEGKVNKAAAAGAKKYSSKSDDRDKGEFRRGGFKKSDHKDGKFRKDAKGGPGGSKGARGSRDGGSRGGRKPGFKTGSKGRGKKTSRK